MADGEVEEALLKKVLLDTEHDAREVAFTQLRNDDANGVGDTGAQHAGMQIGAILKLFCSVEDAFPGRWRDGLRDG